MTGTSEGDEIDIINSLPVYGGDIAKVGNARKMRPVHCRGERIDLGRPAPVDAGTGALGRADPGKEGAAAHGLGHPPCGDVIERPSVAIEHGGLAGQGLPTGNCDIDVAGIEFEGEAAAAGALGGDQGGTGA